MVADLRVRAWIPQYLADPDREIRAWAIGVVDQLAAAKLIDRDDELLVRAAAHDDPYVCEWAGMIRAALDGDWEAASTRIPDNVVTDPDGVP